METIANLVSRLASKFMNDVAATARNPSAGRFDAAILGYCATHHRLEVYELRSKMNADGRWVCSPHPCELLNDQPALILGTGRSRLLKRLEEFERNGEPHGRTARLPKAALEAIIGEDRGDVGGALSAATVSAREFRLHRILKPVEAGQPKADRYYNGINFDTEIGQFDPFIVAGTGFA